MSPHHSGQTDGQLRGEVAFRSFHASGVNEQTLSYMRLCYRERRGLFHDLALSGQPLSPFLDLGAETGAISLMLCNDLGAHGTAVDISPDALRAMPHYAAKMELNKLPLRIVGDAFGLPFRNNSLPLAVCWGTLHHFPDPRPVLAELRRVLAPGGLLVVGDEPVRRKLSLHLTRTKSLFSLGGFARFLLRTHLLPWFVDVDGKEAVDAGVAEMQFSRKAYKQMLSEAFEQVDLSDHPYITATFRSAGPLGRLLLAPLGEFMARKAEVAVFGGAIGARCRKNPEAPGGWLSVEGLKPLTVAPHTGKRRLLLRKRSGHDRLLLINSDAELTDQGMTFHVDGQPVSAQHDATENALQIVLPPDTIRRGSIILDVDAGEGSLKIDHFVFSGPAETGSYWIDTAPIPTAVGRIEQALACPACWIVTDRCRADLCPRPCLAQAENGCLQVNGDKVEIDANRGQPGSAAAVCPVDAIDHPALSLLDDGGFRCPVCGQIYAAKNGLIELPTPRARRALAQPAAK